VPPGISKPLALKLSPPLHVRSSGVSVQFTFAKAGVATPILVVVTAAIIAAVVIAITRSLEPVCLIFCIMYSYLIAVFIYSFTDFVIFSKFCWFYA
jgi:hypothetical protein